MFTPKISRHLLSKSTFMYGMQCTKRLWLHKNLPKERDPQTIFQRAIFQQGNDVGKLARQLFPGGVDASPENHFSYQKSVADTMKYIRNGHQVIYEAAFQFEGILCALDILVKVNNEWHGFEVKSTTGVKEPHLRDAALQYYVITQAGINLADLSIVHLYRKYIRGEALDIQQLFMPVSIMEQVISLQPLIISKAGELLTILAKNIPPEIEVGKHCNIPYPCDFQQFCARGKSSIGDLVPDKLSALKILKTGREELSYPVHFLHLDAWNSGIPLFEGHWPYKQVLFHYSIYKLESEEAEPEHIYYVNERWHDQRELTENLLSVLGDKGNIVVHHDSQIQYSLTELGKEFNWLNHSLRALLPRIKELEDPFRKDYLYKKEPLTALILTEKGEPGISKIRDSGSAAATFFNVFNSGNEESKDTQMQHLKTYAQQSSWSLMYWVLKQDNEI